MGLPVPEDLSISYNRLYSHKGVENEINELHKLLDVYERFTGMFTNIDVVDEYATEAQAEARARELGGTGTHSHEQEDGTVIYMPFTTHEEFEMRLRMAGLQSNDISEELQEKIKDRLYQLLESSYSENSL